MSLPGCTNQCRHERQHGLLLISWPGKKNISIWNTGTARDLVTHRSMFKQCGSCLQQDEPDDYVIGTGRPFVNGMGERAFEYVGLDWQQYVRKDPRPHGSGQVRRRWPTQRKRKEMGWEPKVKFKELIRIMVDVEMEALGLTHW